jgi:hypothetical protein
LHADFERLAEEMQVAIGGHLAAARERDPPGGQRQGVGRHDKARRQLLEFLPVSRLIARRTAGWLNTRSSNPRSARSLGSAWA